MAVCFAAVLLLNQLLLWAWRPIFRRFKAGLPHLFVFPRLPLLLAAFTVRPQQGWCNSEPTSNEYSPQALSPCQSMHSTHSMQAVQHAHTAHAHVPVCLP